MATGVQPISSAVQQEAIRSQSDKAPLPKISEIGAVEAISEIEEESEITVVGWAITEVDLRIIVTTEEELAITEAAVQIIGAVSPITVET